MKTSEDIIAAINDYISLVLENPKGYASNPCGLEDVLRVLESVKEYTMNDEQEGLEPPNAYRSYVESSGLGNATFTSRRYPEQKLTDKDLTVFKELAKFWKDYLARKVM